MPPFKTLTKRARLGWLPALALATCSLGCGGNFRVPSLFHPGPTGPQRYEAIYHDPYPLDDVAPEIVGGRPREHQRPVPQVTRGRLFRAPQPTPYAY